MINCRLKKSILLGLIFFLFTTKTDVSFSVYFSDNPDVDIVGANMYNRFLQQDLHSKKSISGYDFISDPTYLSAKSCESILVCTGVYDRNKPTMEKKESWKIPTTIEDDILEAVKYILTNEGYPGEF